jgi:hypothetical protein
VEDTAGLADTLELSGSYIVIASWSIIEIVRQERKLENGINSRFEI